MNQADLDALSAILEPLGERVCALCGARHPLDAEHFPEYRAGQFRKVCRLCYSFGQSMKKSAKYEADEGVREATKAASNVYYIEHRTARLNYNREHRREKARQMRRNGSRAILESASD